MCVSTAFRVNEIFQSIQGEGDWTGTPCVFVRLSGCNRSCDFCDTLHEDYVEMTLEEIKSKIPEYFKHVVITGGEPTIHENLPSLVYELEKRYIVHVETNGYDVEMLGELNCWITWSPKEREIEDVDYRLFDYADEIKLVINDEESIQLALDMSKESRMHPHINLQPMSCREEAIGLCVAACLTYPDKFRLSLQTHKLIGIQ